MKVTKKLGRRKHSHSSFISRRRLRNKKSRSCYRKKHAKTQKGGKRGRGQKRVHVHTHKRGRRFHRGGGNKPGDKLSFLEKFMYPKNDWAYQESQNTLRKMRKDYANITDPSEFKDTENGGKLTRYHPGGVTSKSMWIETRNPTLSTTDSSNYLSPVITLMCQKKTGGVFPEKFQKFSCHISYYYDADKIEI